MQKRLKVFSNRSRVSLSAKMIRYWSESSHATDRGATSLRSVEVRVALGGKQQKRKKMAGTTTHLCVMINRPIEITLSSSVQCRSGRHIRKLNVMKVFVPLAAIEKLFMSTLFDDASLIKHKNVIRMADS